GLRHARSASSSQSTLRPRYDTRPGPNSRHNSAGRWPSEGQFDNRLEWVPGRRLGIFEIAQIGAKPGTHPSSDRCQDDIVISLIVDAKTAYDIGRSFDAAEAFSVDFTGGCGVINENDTAGSVAAPIEPQRRSLPV